MLDRFIQTIGAVVLPVYVNWYSIKCEKNLGRSGFLVIDLTWDPKKYIKTNQWFAIKQCHLIEVQRRLVLRPEESLPHRPLTTIIVLIYKLTGLSIYSMTIKHNYNIWDARYSPVYELQIIASVTKILYYWKLVLCIVSMIRYDTYR